MTDSATEQLSESLVDELVGAVGLPKVGIWHSLFWYLFRGITNRLASIGITFNQLVQQQGLPVGSEWALSYIL